MGDNTTWLREGIQRVEEGLNKLIGKVEQMQETQLQESFHRQNLQKDLNGLGDKQRTFEADTKAVLADHGKRIETLEDADSATARKQNWKVEVMRGIVTVLVALLGSGGLLWLIFSNTLPK